MKGNTLATIAAVLLSIGISMIASALLSYHQAKERILVASQAKEIVEKPYELIVGASYVEKIKEDQNPFKPQVIDTVTVLDLQGEWVQWEYNRLEYVESGKQYFFYHLFNPLNLQ